MKPVPRIRPLAAADIDHVAVSPFEDNSAAAVSFLDAVESAFGVLAEQPGSGPWSRARLLPGAMPHIWPVRGGAHVIFHIESACAVEVLRDLHEARDLPAIPNDPS